MAPPMELLTFGLRHYYVTTKISATLSNRGVRLSDFSMKNERCLREEISAS